jgi:hypothetical protein
VDFLEANPEFTLSFHNSLIKWEDGSIPDSLFCPPNQKEVSTIKDVIKGWFIPSASMVFRSDALFPLPDWFKGIYNGDWGMQMLLGAKGNIRYLPDVMSVYRKSHGSLSYTSGKDVEFVNTKRKELLDLFNIESNHIYSKLIIQSKRNLDNEVRNYYLKKNSVVIYYLMHPVKVIRKFVKFFE